MKKFLLLLTVIGMVAVGCTDNPFNEGGDDTEQSGGGSTGDEDLSFSNNTTTSPTIGHEGGTATISFTAAYDWSARSYSDWLEVSPDSGEAGNGSFVITAEANDGNKERKGYVSIRLSNDKSYEIVVTQQCNANSSDIEFINNTNTAPHMEFGGGTVQIAFIAKTDWTVTCYADWLSTSKSSGSKGENSFFITAASNPKEEERSGVVAIKSKNNKSYEIKVTQDPNAGILQLTVAANEVLYTTVFDTQINLYNQSGFGGNLISHSYDAEKGYGSIRFDNYVTSIPSQAFKDCTTLESIYLPEGVTHIASDAFEGCTNLKYIISPKSTNYSMFIYNGELMAIAPGLTDVTIPKEVKSIGGAVFQNSKVENLTLYASTTIDAYAFQNNNALKTLTIIDVEHGKGNIGNCAFEQCSKLTNVSIGEGVTSIGYEAFYNCSSLTSLTLGDGVTDIGYEAFYNCSSLTSVTIPSSVTSIGGYAFCQCSQLRQVRIGEGVTSIGGYAFYGCSSLTSVTIPSSVTSIEDKTFSGCSSLTNVSIGEGVTSIGNSAFYGCSSLTSINIPRSVTSIGNRAFYGCQGELIIDSKTFFEKDYKSSNYPMSSESSWLSGSKFTKLTIGDSITKIGSYTFYKYTSLTSVTTPDSVTSIGYNAFGQCTLLKDTYVIIANLATYAESNDIYNISGNKHLLVNGVEITELVVPDSVTSIGDYAFHSCSGLTSVTIPDGVTSIESYAFYGCSSLTSVYCKPTTPPAGGYDMFSYYDSGKQPIGCKIYVPTASVNAYKSAQYWSDYAAYIEGYDF